MQGSSEPVSPKSGGGPPAIAEMCFAVVLVLLGFYVVWQGTTFGGQVGYMPVGPTVFPIIIGALLCVVSLAMGGNAWRRRFVEPVNIDWRPLLLIVGLFGAYLMLMQPLGFVVATPLFFVGAARVLGSRRPRLDLLTGTVLSGVVFAAFRYGLNVRLPAGLFGIVSDLWG